MAIFLFNTFGIWIDLFYPEMVLILLYISLTLHRYIGEWKKMLLLENELGIARKIQQSFLPTSLPAIEAVDIDAAMFTARQVGGDLYDFRVFADSKLGVMIGDVSGKGVPASLFMAMAASEFKSLAAQGASPESVLSSLNARIVGTSTSNLFVTMFYMIFDFKAGSARYSNGAHLPAIHFTAGGEVRLLDVPEGTPLGLIESGYGGVDIKISKGDFFVLYTDGVTEAMNKKRELYGEERLVRTVKTCAPLSSKHMIGAIEKDIRSFEPRSKQHDDITLIVIKMV
jgi:sigma-B regulation protein RsbU (phosphoserine phosphatase)